MMNKSSLIDNDTAYIQLYDTTSIIALPLAVIGLISNVFILYIFIVNRYFHQSTYYLIMISVFSDIITAIAMIYGYSHILARTVDNDGAHIMCQTAAFITASSYTISIMTLCVIAIDRYFKVVKPLTPFYQRNRKRILIVVEVSIWIMAAAITAPLLTMMESKDKDYGLCDFIQITTSISIYLIFFVILLYIVPSSIIIITYSTILIYWRNYVNCSINGVMERRIRNKMFIKALMSIALSYVFLTWPFFATILGYAVTEKSYFQLRHSNKPAYIASLLSRSLTTSITIVSPFTYLQFDREVRERAISVYKHLLCFQSKRTSRTARVMPMFP